MQCDKSQVGEQADTVLLSISTFVIGNRVSIFCRFLRGDTIT